MIEAFISGGLGLAIAGGLIGYGRLQQRVTGQDDKFDTLRKDIARLDERIADLTDFLLRESRRGAPDDLR